VVNVVGGVSGEWRRCRKVRWLGEEIHLAVEKIAVAGLNDGLCGN